MTNSSDSIRSYRARWVVPVDGPPIDGGVVCVRGDRIHSIGTPDACAAGVFEDLGDVLLLPGLVNAHTHLELGGLRGRITSRNLWDWFDELVKLNRSPDAEIERRRAVLDGAAESIAGGATTIGDISRTGASAELLVQSPIRKVCYLELISGARTLPNDAVTLCKQFDSLRRAITQDDRLRLGISPHAPYSVTRSDLCAAIELATEHNAPLTMHFLETADEARWLHEGGGRVADYLSRYQVRRGESTPPGDVLKHLESCGALGRKMLLAHVNYVDDATIARLAASRCSVVWCPRTHSYFGHPPHRWRELLAAGVNVCLGTDSLASTPTLSMLDEMRYIQTCFPDSEPATILAMATRHGAEALAMSHAVGTLSPGKRADIIAVRWSSNGPQDPLRNLLHGTGDLVKVWIGGENVHCSPSS